MHDLITLTPQMMVVMGILALTIFLFATEVVRVDVAAISIMLLLGIMSLIPGLQSLADTDTLLNGFSSNAVMSIIAVMILCAGLDKTGVMNSFASLILSLGAKTESRLLLLIAGSAGLISSFIQNIGAAALYIPVVARVASRTQIPMSRLFMPMGFACILGGTITMVGSSPMILVNDLLPQNMQPFGLFEVTPIGLALLTMGVLYFVFFGRFVLPSVSNSPSDIENIIEYYEKVYGMSFNVMEIYIDPEDELSGQVLLALEEQYSVVVLASFITGKLRVAPSIETIIEPGSRFAVLTNMESQKRLHDAQNIKVFEHLFVFADVLSPAKSGLAELVIPPRSSLIGKSIRDISMRKTFDITVLGIHHAGEIITQDYRDRPLQPGDVLVLHCKWEALRRLEKNRDFVVITTEYPKEELRQNKVHIALFAFTLAMLLYIFTALQLSVALMVGAIVMVLTGVLKIDEAYASVNWKTVFLLAGMIPLGLAVENTGFAAWVAQHLLLFFNDVSPWMLQIILATLATFFTLFMSNIGAIVLLIPLSINVALTAQGMGIDADPRMFAITAAIATSNSFLIPTNQVNALLMGPGGYRVRDFMKAGAGLSILYIIVTVGMLNLVF